MLTNLLKLSRYCTCPVSFEVTIFDPIFSEGSLSDHLVDRLLSSIQSASLYRKLLEASEIKAKMDRRKQEEFRKLFEPLKEIYSQFNTLLHVLPAFPQNQSLFLYQAKKDFEYTYKYSPILESPVSALCLSYGYFTG